MSKGMWKLQNAWQLACRSPKMCSLCQGSDMQCCKVMDASLTKMMMAIWRQPYSKSPSPHYKAFCLLAAKLMRAAFQLNLQGASSKA